MLTPTKNLHEDKTLIKIGAKTLSFLSSPKSVNSLWNLYIDYQEGLANIPKINFDTFLLGLNFLFIIGAIDYRDDIIWRSI